MPNAVFTAIIDLGEVDLEDWQATEDAINESVYDVLDDSGEPYSTIVCQLVNGDEAHHRDERVLEHPAANQLGPYQGHSETSRKAALDNYPRSGTQRHKVMLVISSRGSKGATGDEIADELGIRLNSVRPRIVELRDGDWIEDTSLVRKTATGSEATVMTLTDKGKRYVETKEGQQAVGEQ